MARLGLASLPMACLVACAGRGSSHGPSRAPPEAAPTPTDAGAPVTPSARRVAVRFALDERGVHVRVRARGPAEELATWRLGELEVAHVEARGPDERAMPLSVDGRSATLGRGERDVALTYDLVPGADGRALVEASRFRVEGEAVLALPVAFEEQVVDATVEVDGRALEAPVVASSFGVGRGHVSRDARVTGSALRRAAFVGGPGGHAVFDAPEGHDEAAWLGYTAFDPRAVSAEVAGFRGLLHEHFGGKEIERATCVFVVDGTGRGRFRVQRRTGGLMVSLSGADPFDAPLRLAVAHELVHAWIGERVWLGGPAGGEASTYWFHEGVTRWVAREQLYRAGLLTPDEYAGEVNRLVGVVVTSPHGAAPHDALVARARAPGVLPVIVARGALYATSLDARIRASSKGERSLDDVLRALVRRAEDRRAPLAERDFDDALEGALGGASAEEERRAILLRGARVAPPIDALGGCFERFDARYDVPDPGFDVGASRAARRIVGLATRGPAARAGLREGEPVLAIEEPAAASSSMRVDVERDGQTVSVRYEAIGGAVRAAAFRRRSGLSDEACRKLGVRR